MYNELQGSLIIYFIRIPNDKLEKIIYKIY